jgi:hypothetical protein
MGIAAFIVTAPFAKPLRIQMSALGHKQTSAHVRVMSGLPRKQTLILSLRMSALCQRHTLELGQIPRRNRVAEGVRWDDCEVTTI